MEIPRRPDPVALPLTIHAMLTEFADKGPHRRMAEHLLDALAAELPGLV